VGHRALVAVERDDGRFDCYRSQWGGRVAVDADPTTVVERTVAANPPLATAVPVTRVIALLDSRTDEALVVRSGEETTPYLVRWLGVPTTGGDGPGPTVLVPVEDPATADRLDCTLRTAKGILGDAVDAGLVSRRLAVGYLVTLVARHPDVPESGRRAVFTGWRPTERA